MRGSTCFGREGGRERSLRAKAQSGEMGRPQQGGLLLLNSETRDGRTAGGRGKAQGAPGCTPPPGHGAQHSLLPPSSDDLHSEQLSLAIINSELHPLGLGGNYLLIELASEPFHVIITQGTQPTVKGEMVMGSQGGVTGRRKSHMDPAGAWHVPRPSTETRGHRGSEKDVGLSGEGKNTGPM